MSRVFRLLKGTVIAVLCLVLAGAAYQAMATRADARGLPAPGRLVVVQQHRMHIDCAGAGSPTVLLEAGLGEHSAAWAWVKADVAMFTRVCAYDRAGYGWSDDVAGPRTAALMATELHDLLAASGESGPYVLAPHSFGSFVARVFAGRYPGEVAGAVFADVSHPAQFSTGCDPACLPAQTLDNSRTLYRLTTLLAPIGAVRVASQVGLLPFGAVAASLPEREAHKVTADLSTTQYWVSSRREFIDLLESANQAVRAGSLGSKPLHVVTAGNTYRTPELKAFIGGADPETVTANWLTLQRDLLRLSTQSRHTVVSDATHVSLIADRRYAPSVVHAIEGVVAGTRQK